MNKAQLIELIQSKLGADTTKKHAEEALAAVLESIKEGVKESGKAVSYTHLTLPTIYSV